jgi:dienelactone hydrolase
MRTSLSPYRQSLRPLALASVAALIIAGCGGGDDAADDGSTPETVTETVVETDEENIDDVVDTTTEETTTTVAVTTTTVEEALDVADDVEAYIGPGPFDVGVLTTQLPSGPAVEVWYPAIEGSAGTEAYDVRDFTPEFIQDLLSGDVDAVFTYAAGRDAPVADGEFPVVLFSHGFSGFRLQSTFLTSHLASWGMIVAAPDHPSRELASQLGGEPADSDPALELLAALDVVGQLSAEGGPLTGRADLERVATLGHSAGGGTILSASLDDRIGGYVSMASGGPAETAEFPQIPSFFLAGATDAIVTPTDRTLPAFEAAPEPSWYWEIEATGHNGFDDFCTFGGGTGIIGVAEAAGLGPVLESQPQLRALGEDGCVEPAAPVEESFDIIRHGVTAWLRWNLGLDTELVGFGPAVSDGYSLSVVALEK